jgi:hypothetical protein
MGARVSRPVYGPKTQLEQTRNNSKAANLAYKAGWWATANQTKKAEKNAQRAKLSQLELREAQRKLKRELEDAKEELKDAKEEFTEAKVAANHKNATRNNMNARNDAEDEVDQLDDKVDTITKELRKIRKWIAYKAKTYKAFKSVKVAAGRAAKATFVNAPRMVVAGARILGGAAFTAAIAAYNAGSKAYRAARKELMAAHYRGVIGMLEHDLSAGRNTATGRSLSNNDKSSKRNQLDAAKAALKNIMGGDSISAAQERAGKLAEKVEKEIQSGIRKIPTYGRNGKLVKSNGPKKGVTFSNKNVPSNGFNWELPKGFNTQGNARKLEANSKKASANFGIELAALQRGEPIAISAAAANEPASAAAVSTITAAAANAQKASVEASKSGSPAAAANAAAALAKLEKKLNSPAAAAAPAAAALAPQIAITAEQAANALERSKTLKKGVKLESSNFSANFNAQFQAQQPNNAKKMRATWMNLASKKKQGGGSRRGTRRA